MNRIEAAEKATKLGEWVTIICTMTLFMVAMGWIALRGDDIRADRIGVTVEELDRIERSRWADHPNESRCGWPCIERLPKTGETWGE
jgi:hypothetical protein